MAAALLAGCASNADTLATPSPGATDLLPQVSPNATDGMAASPAPDASSAPDGMILPLPDAGGIKTLEDAKKESEAMEDAIEKLSEVEDAYVVATANTALIGVKFTSQYQGKVDERLKKMVLARVQTVDRTVTGAAVTEDEKLVRDIQTLAETLDKATSLDAVSAQAQELAERITVYTE